MQWKNANRLYSRKSLRQWSDRIHSQWEKGFDQKILRAGRRLYKKGLIKEISIGEDDAITTCQIGKEESYSVVEWDEGNLKIRSSTSDSSYANAIAVAGMLEIEELIADEELSFLNDSGNGTHESDANFKKRSEKPRKTVYEEARILHLVLDTHYKGLICEAYWIDSGNEWAPALRADTGAPNAENGAERGRLIALAAWARKSHFVYSAEFNGYLLTSLKEIPFFIHKVWPSWMRSFSTEVRPNVANVQEGFSQLEVKAEAKLGDDGKLDLKWVLSSGGKMISQEDATLMMNGGVPMLIPQVGIVKIDIESQKLIDRWKSLENDADHQGYEPYHLFSLFAAESEDLVLSAELQEWRENLLSPKQRRLSLMNGLRPYQKDGVRWMARLLDNGCGCLLADEMGLGKTVQVIAYLRARLKAKESVLIVCPASVVPVWGSEINRFAPDLKVVRYLGRDLERYGDDWNVMVTSFAQLRNNIASIEKRYFAVCVIDEAQFIKNPSAKTTLCAFRIQAERRIALTGTPIENRPIDLWPSFRFILPGLLGSRKDFEKRLAENPGAFKDRLKAQIGPFMLRRTKTEVAKDLPEKTVIDQYCSLTPKQSEEYARICAEGVKRFGDDVGKAMQANRFGILSLLTRLRQVSCDPTLLPWVESRIEDSGKIMTLLEKLIEVLGTGHRVVIFSQFTRFIDRIREMIEHSFPDLPTYELTGSTRDREAPVKAFQESSETAAMLVSLRAAGTGITLHAADYVFVMDPWWNPAVENQAIDRVHRIGQVNTVFVYRMIARGTIEERIQDLQREKLGLLNDIVGDGKIDASDLASHLKSLEGLLLMAQQ